MKKGKLFLGTSLLLISIFTGCATTKLTEGDELVKYVNADYEIKDKKVLTEAELREDCDMLKYLVYNTYAGIDEAIANGFDLDATIESIYQETLAKKNGLGTYDTSEFSTIIRRTFSKELKNNDQHVNIAGNLKDSISLYYSYVYFEKNGDKYFVKKLQLDSNKKNDKAAVANFQELEQKIKPGMEYTGAESNLYEMLTDEGVLYRYGLMTNKRVKTILLPVDNEKITVPASVEKPIPTKSDWTGIQTTDKTLYVSLGDCSQVAGVSNVSSLSDDFWNNYLAKVAEGAKDKNQIIFDLRSNPGGYMQFPARILSAAFYNQHMDEEFQKNVRALFFNEVSKDCTTLVSPILMHHDKKLYTKDGHYTNMFNDYKPEIQEFYEDYWKHMKTRPVRTHMPQGVFATNLESFPEPDFKGDIFILINSGSASAAEFGTEMSYLLKDQGITTHLIGENSWGGMKYGGMYGWFLPNSGIYMRVGNYLGEAPAASENPNWHGEGYGWFPDYWATNDTILNTLEMLTNDEHLKDVLAGLNEGQL